MCKDCTKHTSHCQCFMKITDRKHTDVPLYEIVSSVCVNVEQQHFKQATPLNQQSTKPWLNHKIGSNTQCYWLRGRVGKGRGGARPLMSQTSQIGWLGDGCTPVPNLVCELGLRRDYEEAGPKTHTDTHTKTNTHTRLLQRSKSKSHSLLVQKSISQQIRKSTV